MKRESLIILGLIAITFTAFCGVGQCGFINFDDPEYVVDNPHVNHGLSAANFAWAWTTFEQGNYLPFTWLSLMLDATLFGRGPAGFHWVNLVFHMANAVLVFRFFRKATGAVWRSAMVAAIFAVHPLRVESVAWVVERKDVLALFFGLLTMLAYLQYARALEWRWYAAMLLVFAAMLLAKQTLATLPFVLLLLDYWPLGRWDRGPTCVGSENVPRQSWPRLILEKIPLIVMAAAMLIVTVKAQAFTRSISDLKAIPWSWRLTNAPISYARYLGKMVWFGNLTIFYPWHPWRIVQTSSAVLLLTIVTVICLWKSRARPWLIVGWLWFLGVLVPMIGIVQFGPQSMADRFTYFACIGLLVMVVWSIPESMFQRPAWLIGAISVVLGLLIVFTFVQVLYWNDSVTLFTHNINSVGSNVFGEVNLGSALTEHDLPGAIAHLTTAVKLEPSRAKAQIALALALAYNHQYDQGIEHANTAIEFDRDNAGFHVVLAYILRKDGQYDACAHESRTAIRLDPQSAEAYRNLAMALYKMGKTDEAIRQMMNALRIKPDLKSAQRDLHQFQNSAVLR